MSVDNININRTLSVSKTFFDFLVNTNSIICSMILNLETKSDINYINNTADSDIVTFLPKSKCKSYPNIPDGYDPYMDGIGRSTMKIGRIVSSLFEQRHIDNHLGDKRQIEKFVNAYKSWFDVSDFRFEIVDGEDIKKYYLEESYHRYHSSGGTLFNSCMRYQDRQSFLEMYSKNPKVKMLILLDTFGGVEKLRARALLWEAKTMDSTYLPVGSDVKVMDRIYYSMESDVITFKKWTIENGYISKYLQKAKVCNLFDVDGSVFKIDLIVKLDKYYFEKYPYLDTFPYFDIGGTLSNTQSSYYDYALFQTNGGLEPTPNEEEAEEDMILDDDF